MKKIKDRWILYLVLFTIIPLIGCANTPKLKLESMVSNPATGPNRTTIQSLAENWTDYEIHFSGSSPNPALAVGILFDPKNDDKMLIPEGDAWVKVEDKETIQELMKWNASSLSYEGRLMRILSPNDQFFGYLYLNTDANFAGFRMVDEKTIAFFPVRGGEDFRVPGNW